MIETTQTISIDAPIEATWAYAQHITGWAKLMPGFQDCAIIDENNSHWTLKVGVGALTRTVEVLVHVDRWAGPQEVDFTYKLRGDPVRGSGAYRARGLGSNATELTLDVNIVGEGPMAPMWEAMSKPMLPKFARAFAEHFKAEVELTKPSATQSPPTAEHPVRTAAPFTRLPAWLRNRFFLRFITPSPNQRTSAIIEKNTALVVRFIKAFSDGDAKTADQCLAPDAHTIAKGFGALSGRRPRDLIIATTAAFKDIIPTGLRPRIISTTGEGNRVVVEFEGDAKLVNGESYCNEYCMVFTLEDGLIESVNEYYCTILADQKILPLLAGVEAQRTPTAADRP